MATTFTSPQVVCRPALPADKADVLEFTKFIWGGHDYIKYVWDEWLADPGGLLAVAQYGGQAVGLGKLSVLSPGQWWLEGVRVDPKYQGLKIGTHIFRYLEDWWMPQGGVLRWMTASDRVQMHHLAERFGYVKLGEVRSYTSAAEMGSSEAFKPVEAAELKQASAFAAAILGYSHGLTDWGWKFSAPDEAVLADLIRAGRLYWWRGQHGLLSYWVDEDQQPGMGIGFMGAPVQALAEMLADVRRLAARLGFARLVWLAPQQKGVEPQLTKAGFTTDWDGTGFLFEKKLG